MHHRPSRVRRHVPAVLFLVGIVLFLFRLPLFAGFRFIGNSDRWNHHLSFAAFHSYNLSRGTFSAWSEHLFTGFDTLASPGNFFSPLFALPALLGTQDVVKVFNYVAPATLLLTMVAAYLVLHGLCADRLASLAGALVFALSLFSLLKLSQNDNEYLPILLTPVFFHLVHTTHLSNLFQRILTMMVLTTLCFYVSFLQPFSYMMIFILAYSTYRWASGNRAPLLAFGASLLLGLILGAPRLFVQFQEIMQSTRTAETVPDYVSPLLFLRYLNGNIFGRSWREAYSAHGINLSEGNLMFASVFASLLLLLVVARGRFTSKAATDDQHPFSDGFFIGFIFFVMLIIHVPPVYKLFGLLFLKVSFLHTRFTLAALLPIAVVSSLYLTRSPDWRPTRFQTLLIIALSASVLLLELVNFDRLSEFILTWIGQKPRAFFRVPGSKDAAVLIPEALRLALLALAFCGLLIARSLGTADPESFRTILSLVIIGQCVLSADHFLSGLQTRTYHMPFEQYDSVMAKPDEFLPPTLEQLQQMHRFLDNDHYRSVVVCPRQTISVDCSTPLGLQWRIRLADGYLNSISRRYASLPWPSDIRGSRTIRFSELPRGMGPQGREDSWPWKLLSLLNVRNAILATPSLVMNKNLQLPEAVVIERNPSPYVYPRVYFASRTVSVTFAEAVEAVHKYFGECARSMATDCDPFLYEHHPVDYVEGPVEDDFDSSGNITWRFSGDHITLELPPSPRKRFLILNEAYSSRWEAYASGRTLQIYPTNLVMRGVVVPEGETQITMRFRSVLDDTVRYLIVVLPVLGLGILVLRRRLASLAEHLMTLRNLPAA